jgi:hypothetical protein
MFGRNGRRAWHLIKIRYKAEGGRLKKNPSTFKQNNNNGSTQF